MTKTTNPSEKPAVLVTGGTGFLGAYIIRQLVLEGYPVKAIRRSTSANPFFIDPAILSQVEWVEGDILELGSLEDAMKDVGAVIHAAAIVSFHPGDREKMYATNVGGTANVVNMAIECGISRLIHVSSVAALGRTEVGDTVDETKTWKDNRINTHYAISKHKAEMEMWRGMAEGLSGAIINPSTILGYGNWDTSSCAIFRNVFEEFAWYTNGVNGFVYVEDVAKAATQLLASEINMERFIVNGDNWTFQHLLSSIANGFGKKPPYREATPLMGQIAWRLEKIKSIFTGKRPLLSRESAKVAQSKTKFDNSKLLDAIQDFSYTPLENAIASTCKQYLQQYSG